MKKLLTTAAVIIALTGSANASGREAPCDCGNNVTTIIDTWRGKMWLSVSEDHKLIIENKKFYDGGVDTLEEHPQPLNADVTVFRFRVKWNGRTAILRYRRMEEDDNKAVTFDGHSCKFTGEPRYDDNGEKK